MNIGINITGIISPCSSKARSLRGTNPSQPKPSNTVAKTGITAAISAVARRGMPRTSIQATISAVMVNVTTSTDSSGSWLNGSEYPRPPAAQK